MGTYSNSSYSADPDEDGQDTSASAPIEESVDQTQSDDSTDNVGEDSDENEVKHAEEDEDNSLRHIEDEGLVVGRRNNDLPTENLTIPPSRG